MDWWARQRRLVEEAPSSKWFVAATGVAPLLGVLAMGWNLGLVMVAFWLENVVVGFYSILRMAIATRWAALFLVPFFTFHYGMFTFVHGIFVVGFFVAGPDVGFAQPEFLGKLLALRGPLLLVGATLMISHGYSFATNFMRPKPWAMPREGTAVDAKSIMGAAYKRVVILHLVIVLGSFPMLLLGQPIWGLVLLVFLKILTDVWSHSREHRKPLQADTAVAAA